MLGYRSFFRFRNEQHAEQALNGRLFQWMESKNWSAQNLRDGVTERIAPGVDGTLVHVDHDDGGLSSRFVFDEDGLGGQWTTSLTLHIDDNRHSGWVWFDIDNPAGGPVPKPPRLAGDLLRSVDGRDGDHILTGQAAVAHRSSVPEIVQAIADPRRRGLLFLAGTSDTLPLEQWANYVRHILHDTVGLASGHILDADTTALVNAQLPPSHRVMPGTIRTFRPAVDFEDPLDGVRHRILSTSRIVRDKQRALRGLLAHQARELSVTAPLPTDATSADELLRHRIDAILLDRAVPADVDTASKHTKPSEPAEQTRTAEQAEPPSSLGAEEKTGPTPGRPSQPIRRPGTDPDQAKDRPPATLPALATLKSVLNTVLGTTKITDAAITTLGNLAARAQQKGKARLDLQERLRRLENERTEAEEVNDLLREMLEDEQIERDVAEKDRAEAERRLRHVRTRLARMGEADAAWSEPDTDPLDDRPDSYDDLLRRFGDLQYVQFTGDESVTTALDKHDPLGSWAGKCWEALVALDDYCRMTLSGDFSGSVHHYLTDTPAHGHGYPTKRHAADESESVRNSSKLSTPRMLPVPKSVTPSGAVFMGAHFKISRFATISPRMHYYDDAPGTGMIYVGYIGPHLPTTRKV